VRDVGVRQVEWLVAGALIAWLVTLTSAALATIGVAAVRGSSDVGGLAALYLPVMALPLALTTGFVLLPVMMAASAAGRGAARWPLMAALVAAPLQMLALIAGARLLFPAGPHGVRPTLLDDLAFVIHDPADTLPLLVAFLAGGLACGLWSRHLHLTTK
jgi:hypothetical protein